VLYIVHFTAFCLGGGAFFPVTVYKQYNDNLQGGTEEAMHIFAVSDKYHINKDTFAGEINSTTCVELAADQFGLS